MSVRKHEPMISHHFVGTGAASAVLERTALAPEELLEWIGHAVGEAGLEVVSGVAVPFDVLAVAGETDARLRAAVLPQDLDHKRR